MRSVYLSSLCPASLALALCALALAGCTTVSPEAIAANDPLEPMNRAVYRFDEQFDRTVLLSLAGLYIGKVPKSVRTGVHNVLSNVEEPVTIANDVLQLELGRAARMTVRLALNSTIGVGGIVDIAAKHGLAEQTADFGQTLNRYGVGEGPFLVLPLIGPEPPRDLVGDAADLFIDPLTWLPPGWPFAERLGIAMGVHVWEPYLTHARDVLLTLELEKGSLDPYATMRSVYRQIRADEINGGQPAVTDWQSYK